MSDEIDLAGTTSVANGPHVTYESVKTAVNDLGKKRPKIKMVLRGLDGMRTPKLSLQQQAIVQEGKDAHSGGKDLAACPYGVMEWQGLWYKGWESAELWAKVSRIPGSLVMGAVGAVTNNLTREAIRLSDREQQRRASLDKVDAVAATLSGVMLTAEKAHEEKMEWLLSQVVDEEVDSD